MTLVWFPMDLAGFHVPQDLNAKRPVSPCQPLCRLEACPLKVTLQAPIPILEAWRLSDLEMLRPGWLAGLPACWLTGLLAGLLGVDIEGCSWEAACYNLTRSKVREVGGFSAWRPSPKSGKLLTFDTRPPVHFGTPPGCLFCGFVRRGECHHYYKEKHFAEVQCERAND